MTCGGGVQYRTITCREKTSNVLVYRTKCKKENRPKIGQKCNVIDCSQTSVFASPRVNQVQQGGIRFISSTTNYNAPKQKESIKKEKSTANPKPASSAPKSTDILANAPQSGKKSLSIWAQAN